MRAPIFSSTSANLVSPCTLLRPMPVTRTVPPLIAAAAEVRGGRSVALNRVIARRDIRLTPPDMEHPVVVVAHRYAEGAHQMQRDVDVRLGNQLALDVDLRILRRQRRSHQQRGQKLAGDAAVNGDVAAPKPPRRRIGG